MTKNKIKCSLACTFKKRKLTRNILAVSLTAILFQFWHGFHGARIVDNDRLRSVPEEIRYEAMLSNNSHVGRPLPLAAHWNTGYFPTGFTPDYQMTMIRKGHFLLPWFDLRTPGEKMQLELGYYKNAIVEAREMNLPISFISTQWESLLTNDPKYLALPSKDNPNVIDVSCNVLPKVSPFGPLSPWLEVGKSWTTTSTLQQLEKLYPDPPLVLFISNNEHAKLQWTEVETSKRYMNMYGACKDGDFKRRVVGEGWIPRYRELQRGMIQGLTAPAWKKRAKFIGYFAFGNGAFGSWDYWNNYSLCITSRIEPWPLAWDGASASFYVSNTDDSTDFKVWSPQVRAMNWVFMLDEAYTLNPAFWFEISAWDGYKPSLANDKRKYYADLGQVFTPARYGGMVQFGMWLLRPRVVREYRDWTDTVENSGEYFESIMEAIDRVHTNATLRRFWRKGELVANPEHQHPFQSNIPEEYKDAKRWFLLTTNLDPAWPWKLDTEIPVFSLALTLGQAPKREWLLYAYSPLEDKSNVKITVTDYGSVKINVRPAGSFYHLSEETQEVKKVDTQMPE